MNHSHLRQLLTLKGRPTSAFRELMSEEEDKVTDLATRKLDVIYGRKDGILAVYDGRLHANQGGQPSPSNLCLEWWILVWSGVPIYAVLHGYDLALSRTDSLSLLFFRAANRGTRWPTCLATSSDRFDSGALVSASLQIRRLPAHFAQNWPEIERSVRVGDRPNSRRSMQPLHEANRVTRSGRDHRMHLAKLGCITLTTRRERTLGTSQITMTTRIGRRCLRLLPSTCCRGSAPTAVAIDTDDCSPAVQVDFAGKTAVHPSSGWLPCHCMTEPAESGRPTRQESRFVWPRATTPGVSEFGLINRFSTFSSTR